MQRILNCGNRDKVIGYSNYNKFQEYNFLCPKWESYKGLAGNKRFRGCINV